MEGDKIILPDIFLFAQEAFDNGKVVGTIKPTGVRPKFMSKIEDDGIQPPPAIFGVNSIF